MYSISLSPSGSLYLEGSLEAQNDLVSSFKRGAGHGLLFLDGAKNLETEQDAFLYWKDFCRLYLSLFAASREVDSLLNLNPIELSKEDLSSLLLTIPPMKGGEYINESSLLKLWKEMECALQVEIQESGETVATYFSKRHSHWNLLGKVCFHLAENKKSEETPFAFLATYAHQISKEGKPQHLPLGKALEEYAGAKRKNILLRLLAPLQKSAQESAFLRAYVDSGDIYHPLAFTVQETHQFLKEIPVFEKSGISVRVPNWWKSRQGNRPQVSLRLGEKSPTGIGFEALLDFSVSLMIGNEELSEKEIRDLLNRSDNLVFFKGQWVELDREKLSDLLLKWKDVASAAKDGLSLAEGMRLLAGMDETTEEISDQSYVRIISGDWLEETLCKIRNPEIDQEYLKILHRNLKTDLRPYQSQGVQWLTQLNQMKLGAVLADDMGLGKTIQIIALLLLKNKGTKTLLVVPASLIGNWKSELDRFAPSLEYVVTHSSGAGYEKPEQFDLAITTYGSVGRMSWVMEMKWDLVIADEAQAIKNPSAKQTKSIKTLSSVHKIALTGTPVENHLSDLWSLFDFVSPGLLGSTKEFESFLKSKKNSNPYASVRKLVRPYILRRLKTDKAVISDLPDKTEVKSYCNLSKGQAALYQQSVESLAKDIEASEGIKRRGIIFSYLMRFKQICNHPSQFVKTTDFHEKESGKFQRLREICETIFEKQEKLLVFTQFKEMTIPLHDFLATIFKKQGLILNGETPIKKRQEMVSQFQREDGAPFFVLSLKAGGTGLNLTAASHVIHFDRWWNPAVENQATDRAFRIGQKKNVLVHKFICKGTLEEKIDELMELKQNMSDEILADQEGPLLTELGNEELLKTVALDIHSAVADS